MSTQGNNSSSGGVGFMGLLTIVFIILKLCEVISWSWWWVLSPVLISTAILFVVLALAGGAYLLFKDK